MQYVSYSCSCNCEWVSEVTRSCLTLCNPMDCSLPGFSIHGIFQVRVLESVAISFTRRSPRPSDWTWVSHIVGRCFTIWANREVHAIVDTGKSKSLEFWGRADVTARVQCSLEVEFKLLWGNFVKIFSHWMNITHAKEGNLLYSKATNLNTNLI